MIRNLSWRIKILPNKIKEGLLVSSLGCYLYCCEGYKTNKSWKCNAIAEIRLIPCKDNQKPYIRSNSLAKNISFHLFNNINHFLFASLSNIQTFEF